MASITAPAVSLPWSSGSAEGHRFGVILVILMVLAAVPAVWIPWIQLPEPSPAEVQRTPPQSAQLLPPRPVEPPPIPVQPEPVEPEPVPEPKPEPKPEPPAARAAPQPEPAPQPRPAVTEPPRQTVEQAREKAASSGLLALQDQLASMQQDSAMPAGQLRANASDQRNTDTRAPEKDVLASSGGVADARAPQRSAELADHQVKSVTVAAEAAPARPRSEPAPAAGDGNGERAMSNIRQVFDAQKNALYSLYRRELRQDPTLEGKVLLELVIEPDGRVSKCEVVSSELSHPELETRLANRVRLFNFGADAVDKRTVRFPIEFLPS